MTSNGNEPRSIVTSLRTILHGLERNPLAHMMTSHRELFHSNMLAWFFVFFERPADCVFRRMASLHSPEAKPARKVHRERQDIDLTLEWLDCGRVLIENKIFGLPSDDQLRRYGDIADAQTSCWLLSLIDPGWIGGEKLIGKRHWRFKSYLDLTNEIKEALVDEPVSFEREVMSRYCLLASDLASLAELLTVTSGDDLVAVPTELASELNATRFSSGLLKVRAASVLRIIAGDPGTGAPIQRLRADYTDGPLLEGFYDVPDEPGVELGWQLQNGQFRLAIRSTDVIYHSRSPTPDGQDLAARHHSHFDFADLDPVLGTLGREAFPRDREVNGFTPDFIYRYKKVSGLTVAQLKAAARQVSARPEGTTSKPL